MEMNPICQALFEASVDVVNEAPAAPQLIEDAEESPAADPALDDPSSDA